jgi:hypothetical protein
MLDDAPVHVLRLQRISAAMKIHDMFVWVFCFFKRIAAPSTDCIALHAVFFAYVFGWRFKTMIRFGVENHFGKYLAHVSPSEYFFYEPCFLAYHWFAPSLKNVKEFVT